MSDACLYQWVRSPRTRAKETGGLHGLTPQALLGQL
jgi:acetyl-CoA C-acetyltransferase